MGIRIRAVPRPRDYWRQRGQHLTDVRGAQVGAWHWMPLKQATGYVCNVAERLVCAAGVVRDDRVRQALVTRTLKGFGASSVAQLGVTCAFRATLETTHSVTPTPVTAAPSSAGMGSELACSRALSLSRWYRWARRRAGQSSVAGSVQRFQ